ncbi:helix-turn-helix domain-containing protein [Chitinimonas lacunae]|uniref:Transposase n=1 Tax=Chitinimonas lacunae TaxID=1963018 RepID=A0ABV8MIT3_9NEIS
MARPAQGKEQIEAARALLKNAKTPKEVRQAQAVLLPLEHGMSLEETAKVLGISARTVSRLRTQYGQELKGERKLPQPQSVTRNRAYTTLAEEARILDTVLAEAQQDGVVIVPPLKPRIEALLGRSVSLATVYKMLARHGWRKPAAETAPPKRDEASRQAWKKHSSGT